MQRRMPRIVWLVCLLLVVLPPAAAYAYTQQTYATGVNGVGGIYTTHSPQYANREYNQVWHHAGYSWRVWYEDTSNYIYCEVQNTSNPTKCPNYGANMWALAGNNNDNSGTTWTAQTTVP